MYLYMIKKIGLSYLYGSGLLNSLMLLYETHNVKVKRRFTENKTEILFTEKIGIGLFGFMIGVYQMPIRLTNNLILTEVYLKGYNKEDYGFTEKKYLFDYLNF